MKTLLLMRHAKSSRDDLSLADHERPLNPRGWRDAPRMGQRLAEAGLLPGRILASDALRARQTAGAVAEGCGFTGTVDLLSSLYGADRAAYLDVLRDLPDEADPVLVVGHNPEIESLVDSLSGQAVEMSTAAIAHLALPIEHWQDVPGRARAQLVEVWRPKDEQY
ncbi:MAG TPA: histidine phosphatase family protein [Anaerolineae bacterium]